MGQLISFGVLTFVCYGIVCLYNWLRRGRNRQHWPIMLQLAGLVFNGLVICEMVVITRRPILWLGGATLILPLFSLYCMVITFLKTLAYNRSYYDHSSWCSDSACLKKSETLTYKVSGKAMAVWLYLTAILSVFFLSV